MKPCLTLFLLLSTFAFASAKPNVVLVMADDLGYGGLGCYGSQTYETPRLDWLARRGLRFTDFHSNGTVCSPTRASIMTGRYPTRTGVTDYIGAPADAYLGAQPPHNFLRF